MACAAAPYSLTFSKAIEIKLVIKQDHEIPVFAFSGSDLERLSVNRYVELDVSL